MTTVSSDLCLARFYCLHNGMAWERCRQKEIQGDNKMHCRVKLAIDKYITTATR